MEQPKNNLTVTKPSAFITSLRRTSSLTIRVFGRFTADKIEDEIDKHRKLAERLDTLNRSKAFFESKEDSQAKEIYLREIEVELKEVSQHLSETPYPQTIGHLLRTDEEGLTFGLKLLINDLRLFFQVDNMISTEGIESLCPLIMYEYPSLALEEVCICFAQAKKGYYGEIYNRLDGQIILKWLRQYNTEKTERVSLKQQNRHLLSKEDLSYREDKRLTNKEVLNIAAAAMELEKAKR